MIDKWELYHSINFYNFRNDNTIIGLSLSHFSINI